MKKLLCLLLIICFIPLTVVGCKKKTTLSSYDISIVYNNEDHTANCSQKVNYVNNSDNAFDKLYFHLYPNAFREDAINELVSLSNFSKAYPNGKSYGDITINKVYSNKGDYEYEIGGEDLNILIVNLSQTLYPNESVEICMDYDLKLPNINHRYGYGNSTINFGNFYPIACVYEDGVGFKTDVYNSNGDPFYSDVSNYNVSITYDKNLTLANTGNIQKEKIEGDKKVVSIKTNNVRDFCFVLSEKLNILSEKVGNIDVNYYYYEGDENPKQFLDISVKAIKTFNNLFGEYPYSQVSVVKSNFCYGGMEFPNIVLISDEVKEVEDFNYCIVHELAHQWWYGIVGNNEYENAWVDEGLTEYSTSLFFENNPEYNLEYKKIIENATNSYKYFVEIYSKVYEELDTSMNRKISDFITEPEYVYCTYTKGMLMFDALREFLGNKKFEKCLKNYYKEYKYKNSSAEKLIESFSNSAHVNLESFFASWINGGVVIL